jgi:hypothetical protein
MMNRMFLVLVILLAGCVHTYEIEPVGHSGGNLNLPPAPSFFVAIPSDGQYGARTYAGSGRTVTQAIVLAISPHTREVGTAAEFASLAENLAAARSSGRDFLVQPTIVNWEDRATEWSGKPDRVSIRLELYDVSSGKNIDTVMISGKSKWATFGGDHPEELLQEPLESYAKRILGS